MTTMSWVQFATIVGLCTITMLICRVAPVMLLKGRDLPENVVRALGLIPPAAFAALVANDLFDPARIAGGGSGAWIPFIAAGLTFIVGYTTKSLVWCIVAGVGSYALMMFML